MNSTNLFAAINFNVTPFLTAVLVADTRRRNNFFTYFVVVLVIVYLGAFYVITYMVKKKVDACISIMNAVCVAIFIFVFIYEQRIVIRLSIEKEKEKKRKNALEQESQPSQHH